MCAPPIQVGRAVQIIGATRLRPRRKSTEKNPAALYRGIRCKNVTAARLVAEEMRRRRRHNEAWRVAGPVDAWKMKAAALRSGLVASGDAGDVVEAALETRR